MATPTATPTARLYPDPSARVPNVPALRDCSGTRLDPKNVYHIQSTRTVKLGGAAASVGAHTGLSDKTDDVASSVIDEASTSVIDEASTQGGVGSKVRDFFGRATHLNHPLLTTFNFFNEGAADIAEKIPAGVCPVSALIRIAGAVLGVAFNILTYLAGRILPSPLADKMPGELAYLKQRLGVDVLEEMDEARAHKAYKHDGPQEDRSATVGHKKAVALLYKELKKDQTSTTMLELDHVMYQELSTKYSESFAEALKFVPSTDIMRIVEGDLSSRRSNKYYNFIEKSVFKHHAEFVEEKKDEMQEIFDALRSKESKLSTREDNQLLCVDVVLNASREEFARLSEDHLLQVIKGKMKIEDLLAIVHPDDVEDVPERQTSVTIERVRDLPFSRYGREVTEVVTTPAGTGILIDVPERLRSVTHERVQDVRVRTDDIDVPERRRPLTVQFEEPAGTGERLGDPRPQLEAFDRSYGSPEVEFAATGALFKVLDRVCSPGCLSPEVGFAATGAFTSDGRELQERVYMIRDAQGRLIRTETSGDRDVYVLSR